MNPMEDMLKKHTETFYVLNRQVMGLCSTSSALRIRARILKERKCVDAFEEVENMQLSKLLILHANTLDEIAKNIKENVDKFVEEENEMFNVIEVQLKDLNEQSEGLKHDRL
jgi:predicted transcriptional regulator